MNLKEINKKCEDTLNIYKRVFNNEGYYTKDTVKEYVENIDFIDNILDKNLIEKLNNNYSEYYYIYYYCIIFKEELVTDEIILNVIDNCDNKINPYFDIVIMNKQLNDDIVTKILDKTNNITPLDTQKIYGLIPFDLRYHILKREEISEDLKKEVLNRYDKIELQNILEQIVEDFDLECINNNISTSEELSEDKDLYLENIAITVIASYLNCKIKTKTNYKIWI